MSARNNGVRWLGYNPDGSVTIYRHKRTAIKNNCVVIRKVYKLKFHPVNKKDISVVQIPEPIFDMDFLRRMASTPAIVTFND